MFYVRKISAMFFILPLLFLVISCNHHTHKHKINPELIGTWSSDIGDCYLTLATKDNGLILANFYDLNKHNFSNLPLKTWKESISTKFATINKKIKFSGSYLEGQMIIDNYCKETLHKT